MAGRVTKGDLLRQRIVEASLKLFADQGFRATTVQQIADEVGISKQRLLYHFSSKEELHRAVLETVADQWKELLPVLLGAAVRGGEMASRLAPLLDFLRNQPHAARYVMRDIISPEREAVNTMGQLVWPWVEQLAEEIRRGQQDGRFDPEVEPLPYVVLTSLMTLIHVVVFPEGDPDAFHLRTLMEKELGRLMGAALRPPCPERGGGEPGA
ncbi:MAG: TetR/AcrR family transcriptional regulator [Myxococcales bacterium]|nr:TetR/AcrR family transcriptional regulator [Myxococcales bacterium]MCB9651207.1 TetR/AcrR family transcriptional regulator [Deltaproteobacteria bacterium]